MLFAQHTRKTKWQSPQLGEVGATTANKNVIWAVGEKWVVAIQVPQSSVSEEEFEVRRWFAEHEKKIADRRPTAEWLSLIHKTTYPAKVRDVSALIKCVHSEIRANGLSSIGRDLERVEFGFVSVEMLLGFIRGTCVWADAISGWRTFLQKARKELINRNLDEKKLLMGIE